jgi:hypothetical protein
MAPVKPHFVHYVGPRLVKVDFWEVQTIEWPPILAAHVAQPRTHAPASGLAGDVIDCILSTRIALRLR